MNISKSQISYRECPGPRIPEMPEPIDLDQATMDSRRDALLQQMKREQYDAAIIYGDREHGANFGYLTGFEPRFEEAVLVLHSSGKAYLLLGNESLKMAGYSRIAATGIQVPYFSLPNQPMDNTCSLPELFRKAELKNGMKLGVIGWKLFTSSYEDNKQLFDLPEFIIGVLRELAGSSGTVENATGLMIDPASGIRTRMNANEIAHYEFGAALASRCIRNLMDKVAVGMTEMELADELGRFGQPNSVTTICATGSRFTNAVVYPRDKKTMPGDRFSATTGYRGGLSNRVGYIAGDEKDLAAEEQNYLEEVAKPYFSAAASWYSTIGLGVTGGDLYSLISKVIPKEIYGWHLNPGHYVASEEWMSSPVYPGSEIAFESGMMLQMDIIIQGGACGGANAEDGIAIADEKLRQEIKNRYPAVWERMQLRRNYVTEVLGIQLKPEILPLSDIAGYYRPFLLNKQKALVVQ